MKQVHKVLMLAVAMMFGGGLFAQQGVPVPGGEGMSANVEKQTLIRNVGSSLVDRVKDNLMLYQVYPNPANEYIVISGTYSGEPCEECLIVTINSLTTGEVFYEGHMSLSDNMELVLEVIRDIPEGMYVVMFTARDGSYNERDILVIRR